MNDMSAEAILRRHPNIMKNLDPQVLIDVLGEELGRQRAEAGISTVHAA